MSEITFNCPFCQQELSAPAEMAGQSLACPACQQTIAVHGGIIETPVERPSSVGDSTSDADKGKTVRIELPPEFLQEPEKHVFKIKRIQR